MILNSNVLNQIEIQILDSDQPLPTGNNIKNNTLLIKKKDDGTVARYIYDIISHRWCEL